VPLAVVDLSRRQGADRLLDADELRLGADQLGTDDVVDPQVRRLERHLPFAERAGHHALRDLELLHHHPRLADERVEGHPGRPRPRRGHRSGGRPDLVSEEVRHPPRHLVGDAADALQAHHADQRALALEGEDEVDRGAREELLGVRPVLPEQRRLAQRRAAAGVHDLLPNLVLGVEVAQPHRPGTDLPQDVADEAAHRRRHDQVLVDEGLGHEAAITRLQSIAQPTGRHLEQPITVDEAGQVHALPPSFIDLSTEGTRAPPSMDLKVRPAPGERKPHPVEPATHGRAAGGAES
jgi:hypothetical protein